MRKRQVKKNLRKAMRLKDFAKGLESIVSASRQAGCTVRELQGTFVQFTGHLRRARADLLLGRSRVFRMGPLCVQLPRRWGEH